MLHEQAHAFQRGVLQKSLKGAICEALLGQNLKGCMGPAGPGAGAGVAEGCGIEVVLVGWTGEAVAALRMHWQACWIA